MHKCHGICYKKQKTLISFLFFSNGNKQYSYDSRTSASHATNLLLKYGKSSSVQPMKAEGICVFDNNSQPVLSSSTQDTTIAHWPSIWMEEMWEHKKNAFPWLDCSNRKLGFNVCKEVISFVHLEKSA